MNSFPATGALISKHDYRDTIASAMMASAPAPIFVGRHHTDLGTPYNIRQIPACVSHSIVKIFRYWYFLKHDTWVDFSPRFLDILAKRFDGQDRLTGGTFPRLVLKLLMDYGCATEATLPNDTTLPTFIYRDDAHLTKQIMDEAAHYKAPGYLRIGTDPLATHRAIDLYGAISSLFFIDASLWTPSIADADIDPLKTPTEVYSGHQMTPNGYDGHMVNLQNEWGREWGMGGEAHYDPVEWEAFIPEQWTIAEIPADIAAFLKQLPKKEDFHYRWNTNMYIGGHNEDIQFAQFALMILGHLTLTKPGELGWFGPKTAAAVFAFQSAHNIVPPAAGAIGPKTRAKLNEIFAG